MGPECDTKFVTQLHNKRQNIFLLARARARTHTHTHTHTHTLIYKNPTVCDLLKLTLSQVTWPTYKPAQSFGLARCSQRKILA
jgi:hypothetical protein